MEQTTQTHVSCLLPGTGFVSVQLAAPSGPREDRLLVRFGS